MLTNVYNQLIIFIMENNEGCRNVLIVFILFIVVIIGIVIVKLLNF